ncbi:hypothetical protein LguiB_027890 [Lonicera macranthoides]
MSKEAHEVLHLKIQRGVEPNTITYNSLMDGYCLHGKTGDVRKALEFVKARGNEPDVFTYNILINGYRKSKRIDVALELFKNMSREGLILNTITYNTIIGGLCDAGRPLDACVLLDEIQNQGQSQDIFTYAALLNCLCKNTRVDESHDKWSGKINEANDLLRKMKEHGCLPNGCTYNVIVRGIFLINETSGEIQLLQAMVNSGFSADASTMDLVGRTYTATVAANDQNQRRNDRVKGRNQHMKQGKTYAKALASSNQIQRENGKVEELDVVSRDWSRVVVCTREKLWDKWSDIQTSLNKIYNINIALHPFQLDKAVFRCKDEEESYMLGKKRVLFITCLFTIKLQKQNQIDD